MFFFSLWGLFVSIYPKNGYNTNRCNVLTLITEEMFASHLLYFEGKCSLSGKWQLKYLFQFKAPQI